MVILYGGGKKKKKTNYADWERSQSHDFYLYAIMEMSVRGKENFCLSPQLCLAGNKLPHGLEAARGNHVEFKCKKEDLSVMNRHPQRGCVDGQFATVSRELDQTKHTCNLAGVTAWKSHAEIPS